MKGYVMNWRRKLVEDVIDKILPVLTEKNFSQMTKPVFIDVQFHKILDGIKGFVYKNDNEYVIVMSSNQSKYELVVNMCHELVHVCQEECGYEFNYDLPYMEQPHEIEAYAMQEELANKYIHVYGG